MAHNREQWFCHVKIGAEDDTRDRRREEYYYPGSKALRAVREIWREADGEHSITTRYDMSGGQVVSRTEALGTSMQRVTTYTYYDPSLKYDVTTNPDAVPYPSAANGVNGNGQLRTVTQPGGSPATAIRWTAAAR